MRYIEAIRKYPHSLSLVSLDLLDTLLAAVSERLSLIAFTGKSTTPDDFDELQKSCLHADIDRQIDKAR